MLFRQAQDPELIEGQQTPEAFGAGLLAGSVPLLVIFIALSMVAACVAPQHTAKPRMTASEAIHVALAKAHAAHVDFSQLLPARASYDAKDHCWVISWDGKPPVVTVGADFGAVVDDATGKVTLIPGR